MCPARVRGGIASVGPKGCLGSVCCAQVAARTMECALMLHHHHSWAQVCCTFWFEFSPSGLSLLHAQVCARMLHLYWSCAQSCCTFRLGCQLAALAMLCASLLHAQVCARMLHLDWSRAQSCCTIRVGLPVCCTGRAVRRFAARTSVHKNAAPIVDVCAIMLHLPCWAASLPHWPCCAQVCCTHKCAQ